MNRRATTATLLPFLLATAALHAQRWESLATQPRYRAGHGTATDPATGRPLMFGGAGVWIANRHYDADTWRWNGANWYRCGDPIGPTASTAPPADDAVVLATDTLRRRTVLVALNSFPATTWEWDGQTWSQRAPATTPTPGSVLDGSMAFDLLRGRCVLFHGPLGETWEWDGVAWTQVVTLHVPPPRIGARMVHDFVRGRIVLFGGDDGSRQHVMFDDTWEYDGVDWTQVVTPVRPSGRNEFAMAFDPTSFRVLLFGGRANQFLFNDTWSYDGTTWAQLGPATVPATQVEPSMAVDAVAQSVVLVTAEDTGLGAVPRTWEWNGVDWTARALPASPPVRVLQGFADDARGGMLLFGGRNAAFSGLGGPVFADTWRFDGSRWQQQSPVSSPSARGAVAIATDTARQRVVLFGGDDANTWFGDTWEWNGTTWTSLPAAGPAPRSRAAMTWDAVRGFCVLHGGEDATQVFGDTWTWNGVTWQQAAAGGPGPRADHAMAYDSARGLAFVFGGRDASFVPQNDLWQWNGTTWSQVVTATPPPPRFLCDFTYDPDRARFVMHGGDTVDDTWEWDGLATWTQITAGLSAVAGGDAATAWDPRLHRVLSWDGGAMWDFTTQPGSATSLGTACGSPAPRLSAAGRPFVGNFTFGVDTTNTAPAGLAVLALSVQPGNFPLPGGCTVLLQNAILVALQPVVGPGAVQFSVAVPNNPLLRGFVLFAQSAVIDVANNLAISNAQQLTIGS